MQLLPFKSMAESPKCRICGPLKCVFHFNTLEPLKHTRTATYARIHPHTVLNSVAPPMARALLTSLLQEQFIGCSVKRNSNPWACGTAPIINITHTHTHSHTAPPPTHTHCTTHTHSVSVFPQTIKSLRQMKAGNSVFVLFSPSQISITKSCHESGRARGLLKHGQATKRC